MRSHSGPKNHGMAWSAVSAAALLISGSAWAQTAKPVPPGVGTGDAARDTHTTATTGLSEVVVTAQRRTESAQRAAIAIAVVSPAALLNAGVVTSSTLNAIVPSLIVTQAGGANTSYFIRGVGNFTVNAYADPAIAFNYDGVYVGRPTSTTGAFYDLDRVEVLKGPQGILYGRNATGGAINVLPTRPKLDVFDGYASVSYGNYNTVDTEAALNIPLGQHFAVRMSGKIVNSDGYNQDGTSDQVGQGGRIQILGELNDRLTIRVAADYSHQGGAGPGASFNGVEQYTPGSPAGPGQIANYTFIPAPASLGPYSGELSPAAKSYFSTFVIGGAFINPAPLTYPSMDNTYVGTNAEVTYKSEIGTFTFIPAYRDSILRPVFNGPAFAAGITPERDKQFSAELRLDGKRIGPIDWLVGGYYYDENIAARYTFDQYQINVYQNITTGTKSAAVFGRAVAHLSDRWRITGGARYTDDRKQFNAIADTLVEICADAPPPFGPGCFGGPSVPPAASLSALPFQPIPTPNGPPVPYGTSGNLLLDQRLLIDTQKTFDRLTYKVGTDFDLTSTSLLYLSYETGFRSGGFSASSSHPTYEPEYIKALTLGSKNRFLDNKLQINLEAFYWKYTNQQVSHFGFEADGTTNLFTENLGKSTIKGVDLDSQFLLTPKTLLRGSVQYLDNTIDSFIYDSPYGGNNLTPVTGCLVTPPASAAATQVYTVNCNGQTGYNSPKWSLNGGFDQTFNFEQYFVTFTFDARYRSNRIIGFERLPQMNSGSDTTLDASVRFGPTEVAWTITAFARNLTNVAAAVAAQFSGTTGNDISTNYAPPRTYGVRAAYKF